EQQRRRLADAYRGEPHRADQQRADARRERQRQRVRSALADAIGGFGVASRSEGALVQPLDRVRVVGRLRQNGEGKAAHAPISWRMILSEKSASRRIKSEGKLFGIMRMRD